MSQEKQKAGEIYLDENEEPQVVGQPPHAVLVSMVRLIAERERYDGKRIVTQGFFVYAYENAGLYLSREDAFNGLSYNGLVFDGPVNSSEANEDEVATITKSHLHYVTIAGTFHKLGRGHLGSYYAGTLSDLVVYRVERNHGEPPIIRMKRAEKSGAPSAAP